MNRSPRNGKSPICAERSRRPPCTPPYEEDEKTGCCIVQGEDFVPLSLAMPLECGICTGEKDDFFMCPQCRYVVCSDCAENLTTCPYCRTQINPPPTPAKAIRLLRQAVNRDDRPAMQYYLSMGYWYPEIFRDALAVRGIFLVEEILRTAHPSIDQLNDGIRTALTYHRMDLLQVLLNHGATDVDSVLNYAYGIGHIELAREMVRRGADTSDYEEEHDFMRLLR
jgi:hypothetical protein